MAYQVLARRYRPQRLDDVVGQRAATKTLRNALTQGRLAQAFVFAGPRGVGKTTTARILARALNCANGPTPDPCGACDACVEIAEGRDIDVLEIDAATHTQVDNVREVIIAGLALAPVRDRCKVYIIDEVHQLSSHSFNALLKSIEEPPPHVVFMMATTQIDKIPDTILSRSQVYELRTIRRAEIAAQLRMIADAESIAVDDAALDLVARAADGSMRDAQSAFDQVLAFAGGTVGVDDVSTVLGLIGRDPLLDAVAAVADEDAAAVFDLAGRFVDAGYDLRLVCRELSRAIRDLLVLSIDPARAADPEIAGEGERDRLIDLARRFSREDLLRAFDVVGRAEFEIRTAAQPRHHLEMALLRWMHLRKLAPLADLLQGGVPAPAAAPPPERGRGSAARRASAPARGRPASTASGAAGETARRDGASPPSAPAEKDPRPLPGGPPGRPARTGPVSVPAAAAGDGPAPPRAAAGAAPPPAAPAAAAPGEGEKAALLAEIKRTNKLFHGVVVAQAQRIELTGGRLIFTFAPAQRTLVSQLEGRRQWLEELSARVLGRSLAVEATREQAAGEQPAAAAGPDVSAAGGAGAATAGGAPEAAPGLLRSMAGPGAGAATAGGAPEAAPGQAAGLREQALGDTVVKALLELFPAEITDVEKIR